MHGKLAGLALLALGTAQADAGLQWQMEGQLGGVFTSGNTQTTTVDAGLKLNLQYGQYLSEQQLQGLYKEENGVTSARRWQYDSRVERQLGEHNAVFFSSQLLRDDFAGFERQDSLLLGYRHSWVWGAHTLQLRPAAGYRISTLQDSADDEDEMIASVAMDYRWQFSKQASLENQFQSDWGQSNIHSTNTLAVQAQLVDRLSLKVSLLLDHNSEVEATRKNLDTTTSIHLVYQLR